MNTKTIYTTPWLTGQLLWKRMMDIIIASVALLLLSPVMLLAALLIKLESRGPVIYKARRAGAGYRIFDLYKFRTMYADADRQIDKLRDRNIYRKPEQEEASECPECRAKGEPCSPLLYADDTLICENYFLKQQQAGEGVFMKFRNDPRITRIGRFLRNTSIDELPQLFNVLKGDMSIVGNRPLPLYEAEKLTVDGHVERFLAPAGLTGLWQVTRRGHTNLTPEERIELDNYYARNVSPWLDLKILLLTIPALLQKEDM